MAYSVTLSYNPQSTAAVNVLKNQLRPAVHAAAPAGTSVLVGGTTAVFADIQPEVTAGPAGGSGPDLVFRRCGVGFVLATSM